MSDEAVFGSEVGQSAPDVRADADTKRIRQLEEALAAAQGAHRAAVKAQQDQVFSRARSRQRETVRSSLGDGSLSVEITSRTVFDVSIVSASGPSAAVEFTADDLTAVIAMLRKRVPEPAEQARNAQKDTSGQGGWSG